ncbi:MAG: hypothetical protein ABW034_00790 [Steroidobacteraceae bacterium]
MNVHDLSDRSQLCVQTIYKLVGGKTRILPAAVDEHYRKMLSIVEKPDAGVHVFDLLADVLWFNAMQNPSYIKSLVSRYFHNAGNVQSVIRKCILDVFAKGMQRYLGQEGRSSADVSELVEKMHALVAISSFEWVHGRATLEELRSFDE